MLSQGTTDVDADPLKRAAKCLGMFLSPLPPWREERALAALEVVSHDTGTADSEFLALVRRALDCSFPRVRCAAAAFLAVHDPASTVEAHMAVAEDIRKAVDERLHALDVSGDVLDLLFRSPSKSDLAFSLSVSRFSDAWRRVQATGLFFLTN